MDKINIIATKEGGVKVEYTEGKNAILTTYEFIGSDAENLKKLSNELSTEEFIDFFHKYHQTVINGDTPTE